MHVGHVAGGTHAGWRTVKQQAKDWTCECGAHMKYYWVNCVQCHAPRPAKED